MIEKKIRYKIKVGLISAGVVAGITALAINDPDSFSDALLAYGGGYTSSYDYQKFEQEKQQRIQNYETLLELADEDNNYILDNEEKAKCMYHLGYSIRLDGQDVTKHHAGGGLFSSYTQTVPDKLHFPSLRTMRWDGHYINLEYAISKYQTHSNINNSDLEDTIPKMK